jgi:hypothetical protein
VHKRKRDGQIEKLARPNDAPAPAVTTGPGSVTNGAALHAPEAATAE